MLTTKIIWLLIVSVSLVVLIGYILYHEENQLSGHRHHFVEIDHNDNFTDDDDVE